MAVRDIRLPNGTVIKNVPEGVTKEQIRQKAIINGLATAEDFGITPEEPAVEETPVVKETPVAEEPVAEEPVVEEPVVEEPVTEEAEPEQPAFEIPEWVDFTPPEEEEAMDMFALPQTREVFNRDALMQMPTLQAFDDQEREVVADVIESSFLGNAAAGEFFEDQLQDNTAITVGVGLGKTIFGGVGGLGDLIGFEEDNYFNRKVQAFEAIQQQGLNEALIEGDQQKFLWRAVNKGAGDITGQLLLIGRLMAAANYLLKGKKLTLLVKGKSYKELFKVTSLRSGLMGAYAYLTTTGDQETRLKNAAIMGGMSMTPAITSLSKTNMMAKFKDIAANLTISYQTRWEESQERARVYAINIAGEGATEQEIEEIEKQFLLAEAIQVFTADAVFGALTQRVQSRVAVPEYVPLLKGYEFIQAPKPKGVKVTKQERQRIIKDVEENPVLQASENIAKKIFEKGATDAELAPRKVSPDVLNLETANWNQIRAEAKSFGIKSSGKGVNKQKLVNEINKARKEKAKGEAEEIKTEANKVESEYRKEIYKEIEAKIPAKKPPKKTEVVKRPKKGIKGVAEDLRALGRKFVTIDNITDLLDGTKGLYGGKLYEAIVTRRRNGNVTSYRNTQARIGAFDNLLRQLKMSSKDLGKRIAFYKGFQKLSMSELAGIYAKSKQQGGYDAILNGNFNGNREAMDAAIRFVESNQSLKSIADFVIADYAAHRPRLAEAYARFTGEVLPTIDYYTPLFRQNAEFKRGADDIHDMFTGKQNDNNLDVANPFTKERVESTARVNIDLFGEYKRMVDMQEHYMAQYDVVQTIQKLVKNKTTAPKIEEAYGKSILKELESYGEVVANPNLGYRSGMKLSRALRKNVSTAYLAYNFKTVLKQIPSFFRYMEELGGSAEGFTRLMTSLTDVVTNKEVRDFVLAFDPVLKKNTVDSELMNFRNENPKLFQKIVDEGAMLGFKAIIGADRYVKMAGSYAMYKKARAENKTEQQAIELARDVTTRTQPTSLAEELPSIYRNEGAKWFLLFTNQLVKNTNALFVRYPRLFKNFKSAEAREKQASLLTSMAIAGMGLWMIDNDLRFPETEEEIMDAIVNMFLTAGTPVGNIANQKRKGYDYDVPIIAGVGAATEISMKVLENEPLEWRDFEDGLALAGVPITAINRILKANDTGNPFELLGISQDTEDDLNIGIRFYD